MSRKSIWFLASFSAIALTALILVQLVWINDGIEVQERQFDQLVNQVLSNVVSDLEEYETLQYLEEELEKEEIQPPATDEDNIDEMQGSTTTFGLGSEADDSFYDYEQISGENFSDLDLLSGDTMVLLSGQSLYDINRSPNHSRNVISQSELIQNYEQLYANKRVFVERVFNRMVRYEGPIENRLSKVMLDTVVQKRIDGLDLNLSYEYGVKTSRGIYSLTSAGFKPGTDEKKYTSLLYPQDIITTPNFLVIYFNGQRNYIFRSVSLMALISLILIFLLLIISFIAIYVIVRQKKLSEIKNDFISNMTHELKTPISTISLASQMLTDDSISLEQPNIKHISGLLKEESKRLGLQVEKVLQMSIFDQGRMRLKLKNIDASLLIQKVIDSFGLLFKQKNAQVDLDIGLNQQPIVGDETHLSNVLSNLIDNALKYSESNPEIRIRAWNSNRGIYLAVKDNGLGMSKDHRKRVFEKFYRIPQGNIHNVKGFGLGLSYVKQIVEAHHGRIEVRSELGKGSEFTLFLPYNPEGNQHGKNQSTVS